MMENYSWAERVVSFLTQFLPKEKLETFRKHHSKENVIEHNPPVNGVVYQCSYKCHTMVSKPVPGGRGIMAKSSYAEITQYWNKDGNCIGFEFQNKKYMFDKEKLSEQERANDTNQAFKNACVRVLELGVQKNSELVKFLKEFPDAELKQGAFGWTTELPQDAYPHLRFPFQRIRLWNKDGSPGPSIKGMQKEM